MTLTAEQERNEDLALGFKFPKSTYTHPDYTYRLACLNQGLIYAPVIAPALNGKNFLPTEIFYPIKNRMFFVNDVPTPNILPAFIGAHGKEMVCNFSSQFWPFKHQFEKKLNAARNVTYAGAATTFGYVVYEQLPQKNEATTTTMDIAIPMTLSIAFATAALYTTRKLFAAINNDAARDADYAIKLATDRLLAEKMKEMTPA